MKKVLLAFCVITLLACEQNNTEDGIGSQVVSNSASAQGKSNEDLPEIKFEEDVYDFGRITQGEKVSHAFTFTNVGKKNLIITGASGSCGCTVPEWPKQPILPGQSGKIDVVFSSEGKSGMQEKTVTVVTNCEPATRIVRIKADIVVAETAK
jgi:hypothetical protein